MARTPYGAGNGASDGECRATSALAPTPSALNLGHSLTHIAVRLLTLAPAPTNMIHDSRRSRTAELGPRCRITPQTRDLLRQLHARTAMPFDAIIHALASEALERFNSATADAA